MRLLSRFNPVGGVQDFWSEFARPNPYRLPILAASGMLTFVLLWAFTQERVYTEPERPNVTYITTFEPGRSDADIVRSNVENQRIQDQLRTLAAQREERRKELYRTLGQATGLDVDAMEAEIAAQEAADAATAQEAGAATSAP